MEVSKIWSTLSIKGDALEKMKKFSKLTLKATEDLEKLTKMLGITNEKFNVLSRSFTVLGFNAHSGLGKLNAELKTANKETSELNNKMGSLNRKTALGAAGTIRNTRTSGGKRVSHRSSHGLIRSAAIGSIGAPAAMVGAGVGYFAYEGARSSWDQETQMQREKTQLLSRGLTQKQVNAAEKWSTDLQMRGISPNEAMLSLKHGYLATGDLNQAYQLAPTLAKGAYSANAQFGKVMSGNQYNDAIKIAEALGQGDPKKTQAGLERVFATMSLSGGTLTPSKQRSIFNNMGNFGTGITNEGWLKMEPTMQIMGQRAGTAYTTLMGLITAGTGMSNDKAAGLIKLGMIKPESIKYSKSGRVMGIHHLALKDEYLKQASEDPVAFAKTVDTLIREKYHTNDPKKIKALDQQIFGRNPGMELNIMMTQFVKAMKIAQQFGSLLNINSQYKTSQNTNAGAQKDMVAAWDRMATVMGKLASPALISGMNSLSDILNKLTNIFSMKTGDAMGAFNPYKNSKEGFVGGVWHSIKSGLGYNTPEENSVLFSAKYNRDPIQVNLHMDSQIIATHTVKWFNKAMNPASTIGGTSSVNQGLTGTPTAFNALNGGPG